MSTTHLEEVQSGQRFEFGKNWSKFLKRLDAKRIEEAEKSLKLFLSVESLTGKKFLDLGSGSGLFSLAARRLGAQVCSVDYDPQSVACTRYLRKEFDDGDGWEVFEGSALDRAFLAELGKFDVVYSWGVLHHTGAMWEAVRNAAELVSDDGLFFISLYNDQGRASQLWHFIKRTYNGLPRSLRFLLLGPCLVRLWGPATVRDFCKGRPFSTWRNYSKTRGMSPWDDVIDWVGGYPFEVAGPGEVFDFVHPMGFTLSRMKTLGASHGCNEFLFQRTNAPS